MKKFHIIMLVSAVVLSACHRNDDAKEDDIKERETATLRIASVEAQSAQITQSIAQFEQLGVRLGSYVSALAGPSKVLQTQLSTAKIADIVKGYTDAIATAKSDIAAAYTHW